MSLSSKAYILCVCRKDLGRDDALVSRVILDKWWGGLGLATSVINSFWNRSLRRFRGKKIDAMIVIQERAGQDR
jgi:hypothetical protein